MSLKWTLAAKSNALCVHKESEYVCATITAMLRLSVMRYTFETERVSK